MSAKIISFSDVLLKKNEQESDRAAIIDVVVIPAVSELIEEAGLIPMRFTVLDSSLKDFLERPVTYKEEDGSFCSVYYDFWTAKSVYRVECRVTLNPKEVVAETDLYRLDDYSNGNREWLWFCNGSWEQGPGEDIFDVAEILSNRKK